MKSYHRVILSVGLLTVVSVAARSSGAVQTFINDYAGFAAAAGGPLSVIDFETLPDGSPSVAGTAITGAFNYDAQGAHFSTPIQDPVIAGNTAFGFDLFAFVQFPQRTWIDVELTSGSHAIGIFFPGGTRLFAYDGGGQLVAAAAYFGSGGGLFLGVVSDTPVYSAKVDRGSDREDIQSLVFQPIPEPGSAVVLGLGAVVLAARRARSRV